VRKHRKNLVNVATFEDLVQRKFTRDAPNQLWLTDITEHPTREGKVYCCVVLDAHSRRVVGWSIDTHQASSLVTNALSMALGNRGPTTGTVIHSDHGTQFTCWSFTERVRQAGLVPSMGTLGDGYDNAVIESFSGRLQTELLNRQKWRTRVELSTALFEYLEYLPQPHPTAQLPRNADAGRQREPRSGVRDRCLTLIWPVQNTGARSTGSRHGVRTGPQPPAIFAAAFNNPTCLPALDS